jgi:hypothetical protein
MTDDPRIKQIYKLIQKGNLILKNALDNPSSFPISPFSIWVAEIVQFMIDNIGTDNAYFSLFAESVASEKKRSVVYPSSYHIGLGIGILHSLLEYLNEHPDFSKSKNVNPINQIEMICNNFHLIARQLRARREGRSTLEIEDEYDVQDLFHSILWLFFADIRPEEYTPSYAGGSSRMDFLLKKEKIAVETKMTRKGKGTEDNRIGQELLLDIERYQEHPDCATLICFVYDPGGRVGNPLGITTDLMKKNTTKLKIRVFIRPTGY